MIKWTFWKLNLLKIKSDRSVSDGIGHNVLLQIDQQYVSMFIDDKKSAQMATNFDSGNKVWTFDFGSGIKMKF